MSKEPVLIVEDMPINLKLVHFLLSQQGYVVRGATSAEEALEVIKEFKPRLVLADIQLPGMDGLELTRRVKADPCTRDVTVLALTAFAMRGDEQRAMAAGCDGYVTKPIDTRNFPKLIQKYLNSPAVAASAAPRQDPQEALLRELREIFITEGRQQASKLLSDVDTGLDYAGARVTVHRWVGGAGQVGCMEISKKARELEAMLQEGEPPELAKTREALEQLARLFATEQFDR